MRPEHSPAMRFYSLLKLWCLCLEYMKNKTEPFMKQHFQLRQKKRAVSCLSVISFIYDFARSLGGKASENFSQEIFFFAFTELGKMIRFPVKRGIDRSMCLLSRSSDQNQQPALLGHGRPLVFQRHWWLLSNNWPKDSRKNDGQSLWRLLFFSLAKPWE